MIENAAPTQEHKSETKAYAPRTARKREQTVVGTQHDPSSKTRQVGTAKRRKLSSDSKVYSGQYGSLLKEADKLEDMAVEKLLQAKNKKKKSAASAAISIVRATRELLEHYN